MEQDRITLEATVDNLEEVLFFVDSRLEEAGCGIKAQMQIDVAVEEIFVNIASYAYTSGNGPAEIIMSVEGEPPQAVITFTDRGMPYNPLEKEDPDVTLSVEDREIGGLGIFLVKQSMDGVSYSYEGGKNILTIRKNLE